MKCFYCTTYQTAKNLVEVREDSKKTIPGKRFCSELGSVIQEDTDGCRFFTPTSYFWCMKHEQRVDIPVCQAKQRRGDCGPCRQKGDILEIRRFMGRNGSKPILVKRKEPIECQEVRKVLVKRKTI